MRRHILFLILLLAAGISKLAAQDTKLLLLVSVDELTTAQMEKSLPLMGEKGFRRLLKEGCYFSQMRHPFLANDRAAALAALMSGAPPCYNGIMAGTYQDPDTQKVRDLMDDAAFMGNTTGASSSPASLKAETLTDAVMAASTGLSQVYSVAPWRDAALIGAGHAGSAAFWMDPSTGDWCSTTYYKEFPWYVSTLNQQSGVGKRIRDLEWTPLKDVSVYSLYGTASTRAFSYDPSDEGGLKYQALGQSARINEEVNRLLREILEKSTLGRGKTTDVLSVAYYGGTYKKQPHTLKPLESVDACLRVDEALAELLDMVDRNIGLGKVIVCLAGTSSTARENAQAEQKAYRLPTGEFYMDRCATLLNMYLMASLGDGRYVKSASGLEITLDKQVIEKNRLDMETVLKKSQEFLSEFSGVDRVYTSQDLRNGSWSPELERVRKGTYLPLSGDIILEILPGWNLMDLDGNVKKTVQRSQQAAPLMLWGHGIVPSRTEKEVSSLSVASTLARLLGVSCPRSCQDGALEVTAPIR